jgi:hypothetical protein
MTDRVTDEMIVCWEIGYGLGKRTPEEAFRWWNDNNHGMAPAGAVAALGLCLAEIKALREAERKAKEEKPEPNDDAWWTNLTCPKCGQEAVCLDKFGYRCLIYGCGWTKYEPVKP